LLTSTFHKPQNRHIFITNNYNNQKSLNISEKFQDAVDKMKRMIWNRSLAGVASNPHMTKKEVCHHLG
jgi:hypothetical protein